MPKNVAVFTTRQVVHDGQPILWVTHDEDDGAWQFHTGGSADEADAMIVGLRTSSRGSPNRPVTIIGTKNRNKVPRVIPARARLGRVVGAVRRA